MEIVSQIPHSKDKRSTDNLFSVYFRFLLRVKLKPAVGKIWPTRHVLGFHVLEFCRKKLSIVSCIRRISYEFSGTFLCDWMSAQVYADQENLHSKMNPGVYL